MDIVLFRKCSNCKIEKELNSENFNRTRIKRKSDFHRYCRECRKLTRKDTYKNQSKEKQKESIKRSSEFQKNTLSGRAIVMLKSYRTTDKKKNREFNLTKEWLIENIIDKECFYCEDNYRTGCDRLNNDLGHTINNCVPCCAVCNSVRSDIFTVLEIKELGKKIKELRLKREIRKISGMSKKLIIE